MFGVTALFTFMSYLCHSNPILTVNTPVKKPITIPPISQIISIHIIHSGYVIKSTVVIKKIFNIRIESYIILICKV